MRTGARDAALRTLYEVFYNGAYSNLALKEALRAHHAMERSEKKLLTTLVYGVVSQHYTLEYVITKYSGIKLKKLAKYIKIILELGIYQLMYLDKIPKSAAVNESVKLAKKYGRRGSDRFVNAVLRAFCRDGCTVEYPQEPAERLSVLYSYPADMTAQLIGDFGISRAESIMRALNSPPPLLLRANTMKITGDELVKRLAEEGILAEVTECGLVSAQGFDVGADTLYRRGLFSVQDTGAYSASMVLAPKPGDTVIDMCAAPGGKSTHMAELMGNHGKITAFDIYEHKLKLIRASAKRLGITIISAKPGDGTRLVPELTESADCVLCDVPCSGWGIIRRKPDIKLGRTDIAALPPLQKRILENGAQYVKRGGSLVYSTCTINRQENEAVTEEFLKNRTGFDKVYERTYYPDTDQSDGFYICKMIRK